MWNGKKKAITFSYDDGVTQDIRLIEIFNKYGIKGTFNLNSELLGKPNALIRDGVKVSHNKVKPEDVKHIYSGHEVAVHTLTHPSLPKSDEAEVIRQVEQDRLNLSELCGYEVFGMAYPGAGLPLSDDRTAEIIKNKTNVKYARVVDVTKSFDPYPDLYQYKGTVYHHRDFDEMFELGRKFIELECDTPKTFYIWGHAYEFDIFPERWEKMEEFCRMMSGHGDIFYGTNLEVLTGK